MFFKLLLLLINKKTVNNTKNILLIKSLGVDECLLEVCLLRVYKLLIKKRKILLWTIMDFFHSISTVLITSFIQENY